MRSQTAIKRLTKVGFWVRGHWDGSCKVCLGKRTGIDVPLPRAIAQELCTRLNAAITETRLQILALNDAADAEQLSMPLTPGEQ